MWADVPTTPIFSYVAAAAWRPQRGPELRLFRCLEESIIEGTFLNYLLRSRSTH
jgi:hypothetical protein